MKCGLQRGDSYEKDVFVHDSSSNERSFGGRMPEGRTGGDNCGSRDSGVETEIADDSLVVIGYIGVEIHDNMDLEKVNMVIAAPGDDDWTIAYAEGTTTANAMSTFMMVTADGTEMGFMKDGCPMDEDALGGDSGAKIGVVYMDSEDVSFPLEIKKLQ